VGQGSLYALHNLVLDLHAQESKREDLDRLLQELSWVRTSQLDSKPDLYLSVSSNYRKFKIPRNCREVLRTNDFLGFEVNADFYLTDRSSVFHLQPAKRQGYARLTQSFLAKSPLTQGNFWCFGLLKLLRPLGIYSLHAAGLASRDGGGLLLVGPSGSGKSTLAIGLIRAGWNYLSDDAVLLRHGSQGVETLACRRSFYVDAVRSSHYSDYSLGEETPDSNGGQRRRIGIDEAYPSQHVSLCLPRVVIFPHIKHQKHSSLRLVDRVRALGLLLAQSGPQLFDRSTMGRHLELLKKLLQQSENYELEAGTDLHRDPEKLIGLIQHAQGERHCRELSLS
jgi:hypothetical protein